MSFWHRIRHIPLVICILIEWWVFTEPKVNSDVGGFVLFWVGVFFFVVYLEWKTPTPKNYMYPYRYTSSE